MALPLPLMIGLGALAGLLGGGGLKGAAGGALTGGIGGGALGGAGSTLGKVGLGVGAGLQRGGNLSDLMTAGMVGGMTPGQAGQVFPQQQPQTLGTMGNLAQTLQGVSDSGFALGGDIPPSDFATTFGDFRTAEPTAGIPLRNPLTVQGGPLSLPNQAPVNPFARSGLLSLLLSQGRF